MSYVSTILTVNFNSADFIGINLYSLKKLTKNPYKVIILDNGSDIADYEKLKAICSGYDNCFLERRETDLRGSIAHGDALNYLVKKVDTPYFSILDADAIWLKKDWDEILAKQMDEKVKIIGTQAPAGSPKYQDFPWLFALYLESESFSKLDVDCRPGTGIANDTCYQLKEKYLAAGYAGKNIEMRSTRTYKDGPFKDVICGEYYLDGSPEIFASHFGRGSTGGAAKYNQGFKRFLYHLPVIGQAFLNFKGRQEKKAWLSICKSIIDNQAK
ncbi:glycosyltransferase family 2 protein [Candidatus Falkowbacteria bacterium]|nr:glycosyltransferase family 2 protein [Candidatus Falkowbacteria bacterium]